ncbi:Transposase [Mariniphaga anaerophila]|uniref:Transposase n=1 Tax=Mariniphaga anaerophila TaxID=1484053 RepID=A0A1M4UE03_9BACT|nr:transposase [Mariniphaga anaerophila]SHE54979.1 Transposase [Mariniphaga anaerophila]
MAKWFNDVTESGFKFFNTISANFYSHYPEILNFFDNRSINASAESFNAKLKTFRAAQRGVVDIDFSFSEWLKYMHKITSSTKS